MRPDRRYIVLLLAVLMLPLIGMCLLPLADTSEPRYAEIARLMAESGDWITPWFEPGVPFWGKPPLSFWAQAASFRLFGVTDFAARLPSWCATLAALGALYACVRQVYDTSTARLSVLIYASCALVFIASGAVLTDPFLALGTVLCMTGALMASHASGVFWRYAFFIGLAVGLLAKGPLAVVLVGGAVAPAFLLDRSFRASLKGLPWVTGLAVLLVLVVPWYVLAEIKTPGFLDYFLVGEHVRRFLDPGWAGDLYGTAHRAPRGTIWVYWLQASFPWGILALALLLWLSVSARGRALLVAGCHDRRTLYFLGWALFTPMFFTFSGNILWTYLLPALGGFSVLLARGLVCLHRQRPVAWVMLAPYAAAAAPLALAVFVSVMVMNPSLLKTEKYLVSYAQHHGKLSAPLLYVDDLPFSARFYSRNTARRVSRDVLLARLATGEGLWFAIQKENAATLGDVGAIPVLESRRFVLMYHQSHADNQIASGPRSAGHAEPLIK
ncbi:ArnT family glycosyltransferase [Pusillimonas minor]|uniref:Glycosyltransferase family 39 protein n=1 Tax=Pusillimonas minor TaxID=2697024 RepID=A0A842HMZ8_9BURK|nr:glycosyltransferase family 39 protein [Pusillimonas minor]MBC2768948.1 glycosyltransferase family 39 protein [Pusillimonas minor]